MKYQRADQGTQGPEGVHMRILKYQIESTCVMLPVGARVLHVGLQDGVACVWALVNPLEKHQNIHIVLGTGSEVPCDAVHEGTWLQEGFVWHLFR